MSVLNLDYYIREALSFEEIQDFGKIDSPCYIIVSHDVDTKSVAHCKIKPLEYDAIQSESSSRWSCSYTIFVVIASDRSRIIS